MDGWKEGGRKGGTEGVRVCEHVYAHHLRMCMYVYTYVCIYVLTFIYIYVKYVHG
jgi:hypothetical protein